MKVRILTFSSATNYGALLQTYALSKVLQNEGHQVELYKISLFKPSLKSFIREHIYARFAQRFRKQYLPPFVELNARPDADCYIVGSDQVWNPACHRISGFHFFFDFLPENSKRIAYAASFGSNNCSWPEEHKSELTLLLKKFSHISLRESSAIPQFQQAFNITPRLTLDPSLLLTDYSELYETVKSRNTLVSFKFNQSAEYYKLLSYLSEELNLQLLRLDKRYIKFQGKEYMNRYCSVSQWIKEIVQCQFVITDSFHGMVFAIIHRKPFIVFASSTQNNERQLSLLASLGLEDRYYTGYAEVLKNDSWKKHIDYNTVNKKLHLLRNESLNFLREATRH